MHIFCKICFENKMGFSKFRILLMLVTQLIDGSFSIDFDEGCFIDEPAALQVAFVIDRTGTFFNKPKDRLSFYEEFQGLAPILMNAIENEYPGSQFALTMFADWNLKAKPKFKGPVHNKLEACYTRIIAFTSDQKIFVKQMKNIDPDGNGAQENGLSALAFTAADKKLGWIRDGTFPNGKKVRRVLVLVTDEDEGSITNPEKRGEFRGDGTDTCSTSKPPTHAIMKEVFEKYQMSVISLLAENIIRPNLTRLYEDHFKKIGANIRYCSRAFVLVKNRILFSDAELQGRDAVGFWSDEKIAELEELENISGYQPLKEAEITELSAKREKAGDYDNLIEFVRVCLRETNSNACIFGDPVGFNTLGL